MGQSELNNLARIGQLKAEPRNAREVTRMLAMAQTRLSDAKLSQLSLEGRFTSAYNAAHAAALAHCDGTVTAAKTATPSFSA